MTDQKGFKNDRKSIAMHLRVLANQDQILNQNVSALLRKAASLIDPPNREIPSQPESPISGGLPPIADANVGNAKKTSNNEDRRRIEVSGCDGVDMMPIKDA